MTAKAPKPMPKKRRSDGYNISEAPENFVRPKAPSAPPPPPEWARNR